MSKKEALRIMKSSVSVKTWNMNIDLIKNAFGGKFPEWWQYEIHEKMLASSVLNRRG